MTDKEILIKILKKAKLNGYKDINNDLDILLSSDDFYSEDRFIFSLDFAKAFWGEEYMVGELYRDESSLKEYQFNLQQMVLEENPLKYLERFLDE